MENRTTVHFSGDVMVFLSMAIFGSYSLFLRFLPEIPILTFLFAFQVMGMLGFGVALHLQKRVPLKKKEWMLLFGLAASAILNDLFYFQAFRMTTIANAAIAHQMVSVALLLFAPLLLGERTTKNEWLALAVSLFGIIVLMSGRSEGGSGWHAIGILSGLLSAVFYALLIVCYKLLGDCGLGVVQSSFWRYAISVFTLFPLVLAQDSAQFTTRDLGALGAFGLLFAVVASGIHINGMLRTRALHVTVIGKSEPVMATLYAYLFLHETPSLSAIVGGLLIIGASIWLACHKGE